MARFRGPRTSKAWATGIAVVAVCALTGIAALAGPSGAGRRSEGTPGGSPVAASATNAAARPSAASGYDAVTGRWAWRRVGSPAPGPVSAVPGGYLGECVANGEPAICTSRDGISWALPPDPEILPPGQPKGFRGWNVVRGDSFWVATSGLEPEVWWSPDGRHWKDVALDIGGLQRADLVALGGRVALIATRLRAEPSPSLHLTSDGTTWTELPLPAGTSWFATAGVLGVLAGGRAEYAGEAIPLWSSQDGASWHRLDVPWYVQGLPDVVRLPAGGYVAIGKAASGDGTFLTSTDGIRWTRAGAVGGASSAAVAGGRVVMTGYAAGTDDMRLFEQDEPAWRDVASLEDLPFVERVADPPALARLSVAGLGDRLGLFDGSRLVAVGMPIGREAPSPPPQASPPATPAVSPRDEERIAGGWRWHRIEGMALEPSFAPPIVRLPHGYLARCGDAMCTSANGWSWQTPPDPALFRSAAPARFHPYTAVTSRASGTAVHLLLAAEGFWRSTDGVTWSPVPGPEIASADLLLAGADGFAAFGSTDGAPETYFSPDGLSWTHGPTDQPVYGGCYGDTSGGVVAGVGSKTSFKYTRDGRTWVAISQQGGAKWGCPKRLADGTLLAGGNGDGESLSRSLDGRTWTKVRAPVDPQATAVSGRGIVTRGMDAADSGVDVWDSIDNGRSFARLEGASEVVQLADLVAVRMPDGWFVGRPLEPGETASPTPSRSIVPVTPRPYSPEPTPTGGISEEAAIHIAVEAADIPTEQVPSARAIVSRGERSGGWVWLVSFTEYYAGPLDARGTIVDVDYFTGEVLSVGRWIS